MMKTKKVLKTHRLDRRAVNVVDNLMELARSGDSQAEVSRYVYNKGLLALAGKLNFESDESIQSSFAEAMEERPDDYKALEELEKKSAGFPGKEVQGFTTPVVFVVVFLALVLLLVLLFAFGKFGL